MAWYTGLPEAAYSGFMTPYLADQKQGKEDARKKREGELIKSAMLKLLPQKQDAILGMDPSIMGTMANPILDQANQESGYARQDAVTAARNAREDTQDANQRKREDESFYDTASLWNPSLANQWRTANKHFTPADKQNIYKQIETPGILAKRIEGIRAIYPDVPQLPDLKSADDWVAWKEGRQRVIDQGARASSDLANSKALIDYRIDENPKVKNAVIADPQDVQDILSEGMKLLEEDDTGATLKEALSKGGDIDEQLLDLGDEKAYTQVRNILNRAMRKKRLVPKPPKTPFVMPDIGPAPSGSRMPTH